MITKRKVFQPLNLIVFLLFALAVEITVCLPLFEDAKALLQLAWTGCLFLGMSILFFVGGKIAAGKSAGKYLVNSKKGTRWLGQLLFFVCIGAGAAFRLREIVEASGTLSASASLNLFFYLGTGLLLYFIAQQISGFGGAVAATMFLTLCPLFDFSKELSVETYLYTLLLLAGILLVVLANRCLEMKDTTWRDFLLAILGAIALAAATFMHVSAVAAAIPCALLLGRRNGLGSQGKAGERRCLRCLAFIVFYACFTVVIYLVYTMKLQNVWILELNPDYGLLDALSAIRQEPETALVTVFDKISGLFIGKETGEYYNGLLMGMILFGLIRAILLFKKQLEKSFLPIYLFNCYFLTSILLQEFTYSRLILFLLLACVAAGTMADFAEVLIARKLRKRKKEEQEAREEREAKEEKAEKEVQKQPQEPKTEAELEKNEPEVRPEKKAESESEKKADLDTEAESDTEGEAKAEYIITDGAEISKHPLPELTLEEILPTYIPEKEALGVPALKMVEKTAEEAIEVEAAPAEEAVEVEAAPANLPALQLEEQIQELLKREDLILEIMEKQSIQISKLEEELREQRLLARKRERRYRQELAIARNKNRKK